MMMMSQEDFLTNMHFDKTLVIHHFRDIGDVITLYFLVLKRLHQFSCSSHQKQGSPSTINVKSPSLYTSC